MKKPLAIILMFTLVFTLCACNTTIQEPIGPNSPEALLAFDERAWSDYVALTTALVELMETTDAYYDVGDMSEADFYDKLIEKEEYFQNAILSFDYAETAEEHVYLETLKDTAAEYQLATQGLITSLENSGVSKLFITSQQGEDILLIREELLQKAGLSPKEVKEKINAGLSEMPNIE